MADSSRCSYCAEDLAGRKFVRKDRKCVCVRCHDRFCSNSCSECHRAIGLDSKELTHKGRSWHQECFRCAKCFTPLAKLPFVAKDDRVLCGKCGSREDAPRCHACYRPILAGTESVEYKGNSWHDDCFTCHQCNKPISSQSFLTRDDNVYCSPCHERKYAKHCVKCKQAITSGGVAYQDQPWHAHCFLCTSCRAPLAGTRFTSHLAAPYCVSCYKTTLATRCQGCSTPITGFGRATSVVTYEGSSWHDYCFTCQRCSLSLANKRFVSKGDRVYCPDCAQKV